MIGHTRAHNRHGIATMASAVGLQWKKCMDGADHDDRGAPYGLSAAEFLSRERGKGGTAFFDELFGPERERQRATAGERGMWLRYRTDRIVPYPYAAEGLADPIVIQFVNATTLRKMEAFVAKWGLPNDAKEMNLDTIAQMQTVLLWTIEAFRAGNLGDARAKFEASLVWDREGAPEDWDDRAADLKPEMGYGNSGLRLMLMARSLYAYMAMETASILSGGALVLRCDTCGNLFLSGEGTGRRRNSGRQPLAYCSNRCRVAHQRMQQRAVAGITEPPKRGRPPKAERVEQVTAEVAPASDRSKRRAKSVVGSKRTANPTAFVTDLCPNAVGSGS